MPANHQERRAKLPHDICGDASHEPPCNDKAWAQTCRPHDSPDWILCSSPFAAHNSGNIRGFAMRWRFDEIVKTSGSASRNSPRIHTFRGAFCVERPTCTDGRQTSNAPRRSQGQTRKVVAPYRRTWSISRDPKRTSPLVTSGGHWRCYEDGATTGPIVMSSAPSG